MWTSTKFMSKLRLCLKFATATQTKKNVSVPIDSLNQSTFTNSYVTYSNIVHT